MGSGRGPKLSSWAHLPEAFFLSPCQACMYVGPSGREAISPRGGTYIVILMMVKTNHYRWPLHLLLLGVSKREGGERTNPILWHDLSSSSQSIFLCFEEVRVKTWSWQLSEWPDGCRSPIVWRDPSSSSQSIFLYFKGVRVNAKLTVVEMTWQF